MWVVGKQSYLAYVLWLIHLRSTFFGCNLQYCGILVFPDQGSNSCPMYWKLGVLTTELPGKSLRLFKFEKFSRPVYSSETWVSKRHLIHRVIVKSVLLCSAYSLCPTLGDRMDCNTLSSSVRGDSPGKRSGMGSFSLLQGNLPNPGIEFRSPTLQADSLPFESPRELKC